MSNDIELSAVEFSDLPKECFTSDASRRMGGTRKSLRTSGLPSTLAKSRNS